MTGLTDLPVKIGHAFTYAVVYNCTITDLLDRKNYFTRVCILILSRKQWSDKCDFHCQIGEFNALIIMK